jgi:dipeptidyl aminopeptidase/acylaminoacyl peptidase
MSESSATEVKVAPYGAWTSPITSTAIVAGALRLSETQYEGDDLYWLEGRPSEGGRQVLVKCDANGQISDVSPRGFNVRSLVNEYGGAPYLVREKKVFCCNYSDQVVYQLNTNPNAPVDERRIGLTPEGDYYYADFEYDKTRNRLLCVCEDHSDPTKQAVTTIKSIQLPVDGKRFKVKLQTIVSGNDFYSNPRISPDGRRLAWVAWDHPNMPWDGSSVWIAQFDETGALVNPRKVAGGDDESVIQPVWTSNSDLLFISDRSGWWNLYLLTNPEKNYNPLALYEKDADFATPPWVFGVRNYCFVDEFTIACSYFDGCAWRCALIKMDRNLRSKTIQQINLQASDISYLSSDGKRLAMIAGSPTNFASVVQLDLQALTADGVVGDRAKLQSVAIGSKGAAIVRSSSSFEVDPGYISQAEAVEFPSERNYTSHAYFYAPTNKDFRGPDGELPPLIVKVHGGPTSAASSALSLGIQYWTSRGFAVMDVNYAGSSNYGRQYRQRLTLNWGVVDIEDCQNATRFAVQNGWIDGKRMAITGGSAGGFTALSALTFTDTFTTGASHYGISNLEALLKDTHKFESQYLNRIVGPYPAYKKVYETRSPLNGVEKLNRPIIFFQGLEDKVVPPSQTESIVEELRKRKVPFCYIAYEGEQHGFRKAENIKRTLDAELLFYAKVFGFTLPETLEEIEIENFDMFAAAR